MEWLFQFGPHGTVVQGEDSTHELTMRVRLKPQ